MNIIEAYLKYNHKMIIYLSGLPGTQINKILKELKRDIKFTVLKLKYYIKNDYKNIIEDTTFNDIYDSSAYDWNMLTNDIKKHEQTGVIVIGIFLPETLLPLPQLHFHINAPKDVLVKYLTKKGYTQSKIINIVFSHYLKEMTDSKVTKFLKNSKSVDENYDILIDYLFEFIDNYFKEKKNK